MPVIVRNVIRLVKIQTIIARGLQKKESASGAVLIQQILINTISINQVFAKYV